MKCKMPLTSALEISMPNANAAQIVTNNTNDEKTETMRSPYSLRSVIAADMMKRNP